jgi:hypothetical protein
MSGINSRPTGLSDICARMKLLLVPILMLLTLIQSFSKWIILADFQANRAYIAATMCENRSRPQMKCGGRCQLMKKMAEDEKAANNSTIKVKFEEVPWPRVFAFLEPPSVLSAATPKSGHYARSCAPPMLAAPFRPPDCGMHI